MSKNNVSATIAEVSSDHLDEYGPAINYPAPSAESLEGLMATYKTKSAVIRYLDSQGWKRGQIAKFMEIRYQHVRNVLTQPLKKV